MSHYCCWNPHYDHYVHQEVRSCFQIKLDILRVTNHHCHDFNFDLFMVSVNYCCLTMVAISTNSLPTLGPPPPDSTFSAGVFATDDQTFMVPSAWGWIIQGHTRRTVWIEYIAEWPSEKQAFIMFTICIRITIYIHTQSYHMI